MNIGNEKLLDIAILVVLMIAAYLAIDAMGGESARISDRLSSTRSTVKQLTATRDRLAVLPDIRPLTRSWRSSRNITRSCGVERTVLKSKSGESLYAGAGKFWTAQISGSAIAVLACAKQLADLDQVAFEAVSIASDDKEQSAQITFSMYGTFAPDQGAG